MLALELFFYCRRMTREAQILVHALQNSKEKEEKGNK